MKRVAIKIRQLNTDGRTRSGVGALRKGKLLSQPVLNLKYWSSSCPFTHRCLVQKQRVEEEPTSDAIMVGPELSKTDERIVRPEDANVSFQS